MFGKHGKTIELLCRSGGGNRVCCNLQSDEESKTDEICYCSGCCQQKHLPKHPYYVMDYDAAWDSTYAYTVFSIPSEHKEECEKMWQSICITKKEQEAAKKKALREKKEVEEKLLQEKKVAEEKLLEEKKQAEQKLREKKKQAEVKRKLEKERLQKEKLAAQEKDPVYIQQIIDKYHRFVVNLSKCNQADLDKIESRNAKILQYQDLSEKYELKLQNIQQIVQS